MKQIDSSVIMGLVTLCGISGMATPDPGIDPYKFQRSSLSRKTPEERAKLRSRRKVERTNRKKGKNRR